MHAYIEITPFDLIKYEVDKETGYLHVNRPQRTSSLPPTLCGFISQTYCAECVKALSPKAEHGDHDPLDICVLSERLISRAEVILNARVFGGIHMIDYGEADDKIIAVLQNDPLWRTGRDISDIPQILIERLRHYFLTYKLIPGEDSQVSIENTYDCAHALKVIEASIDDYNDKYREK